MGNISILYPDKEKLNVHIALKMSERCGTLCQQNEPPVVIFARLLNCFFRVLRKEEIKVKFNDKEQTEFASMIFLNFNMLEALLPKYAREVCSPSIALVLSDIYGFLDHMNLMLSPPPNLISE